MSGRSGRHIDKVDGAGLVVVQAYNTEHLSIEYAKNHDFEGFAEKELEHRKAFHYPPYGKLISFRIQGMSLTAVQTTCDRLVARAKHLQETYQL